MRELRTTGVGRVADIWKRNRRLLVRVPGEASSEVGKRALASCGQRQQMKRPVRRGCDWRRPGRLTDQYVGVRPAETERADAAEPSSFARRPRRELGGDLDRQLAPGD